MCWNREVSLITGWTATVFSLYLFWTGKGNDIPVALVALTVGFMQFAEAEMWKESVAEETNREATSNKGGQLGILTLTLQPLAFGLGLLWLYKLSWLLYIAFVGLWSILAIPLLRDTLSRDWPVTPGCGGHLQWSFLKSLLDSPFAILYWGIMLGGWLFLKPFSTGVSYACMAVATWGITYLFYPGEWGSLWCFIANGLVLGRLL